VEGRGSVGGVARDLSTMDSNSRPRACNIPQGESQRRSEKEAHAASACITRRSQQSQRTGSEGARFQTQGA
jgi:hypothetical protein